MSPYNLIFLKLFMNHDVLGGRSDNGHKTFARNKIHQQNHEGLLKKYDLIVYLNSSVYLTDRDD